MRTIEERLDILEQKIQSEDFRKNTGLGNEVGYYVFDYDPSQELTVRTRVKKLQETNTEKKFGYELIVYDLYELMLKLIQEDDEYDDLKEMEEEEGTDYIFTSIQQELNFDDENSIMIQYIMEHTPDDAVVFLTGVGKCFPILRSHKILNNLHQQMDHCPVVMFFPGVYNGNSLRIFGEIKDDNYYRAFPLVER
ncbi:MAG: DUF1788 domain-containing protein [Lachnospiraceae bacterium]|uniref:DUF1788 domain-containing protein n=1 Tax=Galactobacillus timonensis TaxID=2041840 RepID=UPI000C850A38|nr:DUF1788 domain-containing protein [Galactobacillus timonensis]MDD7087351.1 DUF1788 domain-containing protein [Galactobacillus timonensis]MDY5223495.1 DUF1788 domain-containing protein [Lachnospiraceae bacterium]